MLRMLRTDVQKGREQLIRCVRENEAKLMRLRDVDKALSEPQVTDADVDSMEQDIERMQLDIKGLESAINEHSQDSRLLVYKQQASLVAKKKEAVLKDHRELEEERDELSKRLSQKEREYE